MPYGILAADQISTSVTGVSLGAGNATRFKNRIINGDMRIDQRNAGASVTATSTAVFAYTLDRWSYNVSQASKFTIQQNAGSVTPPAGFTNYLGVTSSAATSLGANDYYGLMQWIEGLNTADLDFGTANAKTVTLSFWVRSSLTGSFGGSLQNSGQSRNYPFTYTINSANTWEQKTVTIAGDTSGTWLKTNGIGIGVYFGLGVGTTYGSGTANAWTSSLLVVPTGSTSVVGTSGATFYITGVQLEVGSSATGFEYVDYTTQLLMCQRYYTYINSAAGSWSTGSAAQFFVPLSCPMRTTPALAYTGSIAGQSQSVNTYNSTTQPSFINGFAAATGNGLPNNRLDFGISGFNGAGNLNTACILFGQTITASAEL